MKRYAIEFKTKGSSTWVKLLEPDDVSCHESDGLHIINAAVEMRMRNYLGITYRVVDRGPAGAHPPQGSAPPKQVSAVDSKIAASAKKIPLSMVPLWALRGVARVFGFGGKKHGKGNYYRATLADGAGERYLGGAIRHLMELQESDGTYTAKSLASIDDESGLPHLDHAMCGLLMLRQILTKENALSGDPGEGKTP